MNVKTEPSDGAAGNKASDTKSNAKDSAPPTEKAKAQSSSPSKETVPEVSLSSGKGKLILYSFKSPLYMVLNH